MIYLLKNIRKYTLVVAVHFVYLCLENMPTQAETEIPKAYIDLELKDTEEIHMAKDNNIENQGANKDSQNQNIFTSKQSQYHLRINQ